MSVQVDICFEYVSKDIPLVHEGTLAGFVNFAVLGAEPEVKPVEVTKEPSFFKYPSRNSPGQSCFHNMCSCSLCSDLRFWSLASPILLTEPPVLHPSVIYL